MTLGLGIVALASPVLLLTDPIRQRDVADRLWSPLRQHAIVVPHPIPPRH
jgi:hypothetical protein